MKQGKLCWVMFAVALGMVACKGDPTDSLRNGANELRASPGSVFVPQGDSVAIILESLDEQGNRLEANFNMTSSDPAGLPVDRDNGFIPIYDENNQLVPPPAQTRARFFVKGGALVAGSLTATSGGLTQTIPVISVPAVQGTNFLVGVLSSTVTALGDVVTVTIPPPWKFSPTAVAIPAAPGRAITVGVSADSTTLTFIPGPGIDTLVTFGPAVLTYGPTGDPFAPALDTFRLKSSVSLNSPPINSVTISATTPALGATVTATAPAGFKFTSASTVLVIDTTTHDTTLTAVTGLSADSSQLTFIPAPTSFSGLTEINNQVVEVLPNLGLYTILGSQTLTAPAPPASFTGVLSDATPALQDTVTLTANAPFKFLPSVVLHHGSATGTPAIVLSVSADSSTVSFIAAPGAAAGTLFADDVVLGFLPGAPFTGLPSNASITSAAGFAGTGSVATAPVLALPASGATITYVDVGTRNTVPECTSEAFGAPCRVYTINVAAAGDLTFNLTWEGTTDMGVYVIDGTPALLDACDSGGNGGGGPENCTITFPAAGAYTVALVDFGPFYPEPTPAWVRLDISAP